MKQLPESASSPHRTDSDAGDLEEAIADENEHQSANQQRSPRAGSFVPPPRRLASFKDAVRFGALGLLPGREPSYAAHQLKAQLAASAPAPGRQQSGPLAAVTPPSQALQKLFSFKAGNEDDAVVDAFVEYETTANSAAFLFWLRVLAISLVYIGWAIIAWHAPTPQP